MDDVGGEHRRGLISAVHAIGTALTAFGNCGPTCSWFYGEAVFGNLDARKEK